MVRLVEQLERFVLSTNLRGVRSTIKELEAKFARKPSPASAVDSGAVQALLGALNQSRRDLQVTEAVLSSIMALGHRPMLLQAPISVSLLLRTEGLLGVCRAANEHRGNAKVQAMVLRIFANCCRDEQGCRMVVFGPGVSFLLEAISRGRQEALGRESVALALSALAQCAVFHWEARKLASKASVMLDLIDLCRRYAAEADVLEPAMCLLCMMSTGVEALLTRQEDLDDIGSIALNMLNVFALRTFDEAVAVSTTATTTTTANVTPSKFQSLTARFTSPLSAPPSSASPPFPTVTSSTERRGSSWCLLLLGNLAKFNKQVRNQIIQTIVQTGVRETELRYQQILEKLLASCLDDVVAADAAEDGKDFVNLAAVATTEQEWSILSQSEDALMAKVLFCADPSGLFQDAQLALLSELGKTKVAPLSELGGRLLTLMFAMLQHPIVRAKLSVQVLNSAVVELLPAIKAKSGENGEYFTLLTKQLEHKLDRQFPVHIPFRAFPLLVDATAERKSVLDLEAVDFSFAGWRYNPKELCHQITLKMEALFASVDNTTCHVHREQNQKFLAFHANLQYAIKLELLLQGDESVRASVLECIVDVASYSATGIVGNLDLTLICLALLQSKEVARLGLTWKRVREPYRRVLKELLTLATFQDLHELDRTMLPPPLLQSPRIPYLKGFLSAMDKTPLDVNNSEAENGSYACFNAWFPNLSKSGDWYGRKLQIAPLPGVQIALGRIALTAAAARSSEEEGEEETDLMQLSNKLEPDWLIDQGEAHDALVLQSQMEQLVEGLDSVKLVQKRQLSIESSGKLVSVLVEELVSKKKLARPIPVAAKICLERIILGPISSRLFLQAVQSCELEEREFQTQLSKIKLLGSEEAWLAQFDIPAKFAQVPWRGAVAVLNQWICSPTVASPSSSLGVLLRFKDELFLEAKANKLKHLTAEDLIPIVVLILVRSQVLNYYLCSHLYFIKTFLGDDELAKQGEALYYLITLESAVYQVRKHSL